MNKKAKQWLRERLPKSKKELRKLLIEQLKGLGKALMFYGVVFAVFYLSLFLLSSVSVWGYYLLNPWIKGEVAIEMLKVVVNVDTALIGFTGIIAVYGLREISRTVEKAGGSPYTMIHLEKLESWRTNFVWLLLATVIIFAASILFSLQSMSYATSCGLADNVIKCSIVDPQSSSRFLWPLYAMFLGMAGILWIARSLRTPLK